MVSEELLIACIGMLGSCMGSVAGVLASARLTRYRLEQLEKKVDKHNNLVERTYRLEETEAVLTEKLKVVNHRLEDLERK